MCLPEDELIIQRDCTSSGNIGAGTGEPSVPSAQENGAGY